nr:CBM3(CipA)-mEos2 fusion [synthetic construct]
MAHHHHHHTDDDDKGMANTPVSGNLKVEFYNSNPSDTTNSINPQFKVTNTGSSAIDLSKLTLRYYYTVDGQKDQTFWCDHAAIIGSNGSYNGITSNVKGTFVKMSSSTNNADTYLEISFTGGTLEPGAHVQIQGRFAKNDWSNYTQSNDYSFKSASQFVEWDQVTAYLNGVLVWGKEPRGTTTTRRPATTTGSSPGPTQSMGAIKPDMKIKLRMEGNVNGHHFVIDGDGTGKPFEGKQSMDLEVKEGGPLPFAFDILTTAFHYGNRVFAKYPDNIQDYFKQSFPKGYSWERSLTFEDGGICIARNDITMEGDTFYNKVRFYGTNFPANGPVMQKKTLKWEPSTEKMYVRDGVLTGDIHMALLLEGNAHYRCDFRTTYKAKEKGVKLPGYHFVDHCIEILSHDKDYNKVKLYEHAVAHSGLPDNARRGS